MPLHPVPARNLATVTKSRPQWRSNTPRWLLRLLPWVDVDGGVYRINSVESSPKVQQGTDVGKTLPRSYAEYIDKPKEISLGSTQTVMEVFTRVAHIYSEPFDQVQEQLRMTILAAKEEQEHQLLYDPDFGLLNVAAPEMRAAVQGGGGPTPDDMDRLLRRVWKWPGFFLANPQAIEAFGRACSAKGINLDAIEMFGVPFVTWRGVPIVPTDKLAVNDGTTSILLMRVGEQEQGVIGLHQDDIGDPQLPSLVVEFMGMSAEGVASYLVTNYFAAAVLTSDALGILDNVKV